MADESLELWQKIALTVVLVALFALFLYGMARLTHDTGEVVAVGIVGVACGGLAPRLLRRYRG